MEAYMNVREFVVQIPFLCDAKNAERHAKKNELIFDFELKDEKSPFARTEYDKKEPYNRMEVLFGFQGDPGKISQCKRLFRIMELSHYKAKHEEDVSKELNPLIDEAILYESDYLEISSALSVDSAIDMSMWN
jgi:uncharacterized protein YfeS